MLFKPGRWIAANLFFAAALMLVRPGWAAEKGVPLESLYDEGFWFVGVDDKLRVGGWAQVDARLLERSHPGADTFANRRARLYGTGYLERHFGYLIMVALERASSPLQFAWMEYNQYPALKLRIGQFKQPFSLEELTADLYLDLMERSTGTSNFSPAQDMGVMLHGKLWGNRFEYATGAFNGRGKNVEDNNDGKDLAGRLMYGPFLAMADHWAQGLTLGLNGTIGKQSEDLSGKSLTTAAQTRFLTYASEVSLVDDDKSRIGTDLEWPCGPASLKGEWTRTTLNNVRRGPLAEDAVFDSWYVSATYLLTGEKKPRSKAVKPDNPFDPSQGKWGAWELAVRYEDFLGRQSLIDHGFATGTNEARAFTSGINWTPNSHIRVSLNHVYASFDDPVTVNGKVLTKEGEFLFRGGFEF